MTLVHNSRNPCIRCAEIISSVGARSMKERNDHRSLEQGTELFTRKKPVCCLENENKTLLGFKSFKVFSVNSFLSVSNFSRFPLAKNSTAPFSRVTLAYLACKLGAWDRDLAIGLGSVTLDISISLTTHYNSSARMSDYF